MLKKQVVSSVILLTVFCLAAEAADRLPKYNYTYQQRNRPDPFLSFLDGSKIMQPDLPLDPPRKRGGLSFEPGQLKLVGIVFMPDGQKKAVAEDVAGKGYFLYEGLPIGKYGTVKKLNNGQVVIEESWRTTSGRLIAKETVMRLKTEGE
ncbi:hypothetical protein VU07_01650 [Desulfobulbus sp. F4]|nr:hypothetical protein [Desulfobulbus sp. F4]